MRAEKQQHGLLNPLMSSIRRRSSRRREVPRFSRRARCRGQTPRSAGTDAGDFQLRRSESGIDERGKRGVGHRSELRPNAAMRSAASMQLLNVGTKGNAYVALSGLIPRDAVEIPSGQHGDMRSGKQVPRVCLIVAIWDARPEIEAGLRVRCVQHTLEHRNYRVELGFCARGSPPRAARRSTRRCWRTAP